MFTAVNIAMYNCYGNTGTLRVIARNGMRVTEEQLSNWSGGGNVVDRPALRWLAGMPPRRIWVSDMYVFGAGNNLSFNCPGACGAGAAGCGSGELAAGTGLVLVNGVLPPVKFCAVPFFVRRLP